VVKDASPAAHRSHGRDERKVCETQHYGCVTRVWMANYRAQEGDSIVTETDSQRSQISNGPPLALVVDPTPPDALFFGSVLTADAFLVSVAHDFHRAKALLDAHSPTVLLVEIRLGDYNGLQLVLRAAAISPMIATLVTSRVEDAVLHREAEGMGATFFLKPITAEELSAAVARTVTRTAQRTTELIRPPFERRSQDRRSAEPAPVVVERRKAQRRADLTRFPPHAMFS
jgi:two-component system, cell cycle response regulator DivK